MSGPNFEKMELIPVIAQDDETGDVLMLAYMNEEAWGETLKTGRVCYYSRSRSGLPADPCAAAARNCGERVKKAATFRKSKVFSTIATPTHCSFE